MPAPSVRFDPSLLYAECSRCKAPVLWLANPSEDLLWMGIPAGSLDADCLLLYEGCPNCCPEKKAYEARFIRFGHRRELPASH